MNERPDGCAGEWMKSCRTSGLAALQMWEARLMRAGKRTERADKRLCGRANERITRTDKEMGAGEREDTGGNTGLPASE